MELLEVGENLDSNNDQEMDESWALIDDSIYIFKQIIVE